VAVGGGKGVLVGSRGTAVAVAVAVFVGGGIVGEGVGITATVVPGAVGWGVTRKIASSAAIVSKIRGASGARRVISPSGQTP
jgi:hypothetical protein